MSLYSLFSTIFDLNMSTMEKKFLGDITEVRFGSYEEPKPVGSGYYLQVRQFNEDGRLISQPEFIDITPKNHAHVLREGDVLFVGKGNRLFSWCYEKMEWPVIASSIFFVLRPDLRVVYPEYLSAILNAPQSKSFFLQIGSGTNILSIRKSELSAFKVPLPAIAEQKAIAALAELHQREVALSRQLMEQKQRFYTAMISKLIK